MKGWTKAPSSHRSDPGHGSSWIFKLCASSRNWIIPPGPPKAVVPERFWSGPTLVIGNFLKPSRQLWFSLDAIFFLVSNEPFFFDPHCTPPTFGNHAEAEAEAEAVHLVIREHRAVGPYSLSFSLPLPFLVSSLHSHTTQLPCNNNNIVVVGSGWLCLKQEMIWGVVCMWRIERVNHYGANVRYFCAQAVY